MTFKEIKEAATSSIPAIKVQINKKKEELVVLERMLEEQQGMLADATTWMNSEY